MGLTTSPNHPQPEMLEVGKAKGNPFEQSDFAIHSFDKATGDAVREKVEDFSLPICQGFTECVQVREPQCFGILDPLN